jgi:hypothetical protein
MGTDKQNKKESELSKHETYKLSHAIIPEYSNIRILIGNMEKKTTREKLKGTGT